MSVHVLHFEGSRPRIGEPVAPGSGGDVVAIHSRRAAPPPMPAEVWDAIDLAGQGWEELRARGQEVRFEADERHRIAATLRDLDGGVVRSLPLRGVLGDGDGDGPLSAA